MCINLFLFAGCAFIIFTSLFHQLIIKVHGQPSPTKFHTTDLGSQKLSMAQKWQICGIHSSSYHLIFLKLRNTKNLFLNFHTHKSRFTKFFGLQQVWLYSLYCKLNFHGGLHFHPPFSHKADNIFETWYFVTQK